MAVETAQRAVISPVNIEARQTLGIRPGDTVRVSQKIEEKGKTRLQVFEGLVLSVKHGGEAGATFTVRRVTSGVGVERIFPLYSPLIDKIEIVRRSKVRRAKLYYIREKVAKEIRRQMRNMRLMDLSTGSDAEQKETAQSEEIETQKDETQADASSEVTEEAKVEQPETQEVPTPQENNQEGRDSDSSETSEDVGKAKKE